jgi:hypothetical protein
MCLFDEVPDFLYYKILTPTLYQITIILSKHTFLVNQGIKHLSRIKTW